MIRLLLVAVVSLIGSPLIAQEGRIRAEGWGSELAPASPIRNARPLRILKIINGIVPAYNLDGTPIDGTQIKYVLVDQWGRQKGAVGSGVSDTDNKTSIGHFDGYIDASKVKRFAAAKTTRGANGSIQAFRPGTKTPIFALQAQSAPSQGLVP